MTHYVAARYVARLGARPDFLYQNALKFPFELRVADIAFELFLARFAPTQGLKLVFRQNYNVFARLAARALITVFDDVPAERLDHFGKQQDFSSEGTAGVFLARNRMSDAQQMKILAHASPVASGAIGLSLPARIRPNMAY